MSRTQKTNHLSINSARFWGTIERSSELGTGPRGGLRRLALGEADVQMRQQFVAWCEEAGCTVSVDKLGNIFARREGTEALDPILIGSHLDTQASGGRFDGIVGVLAGLEVIRSLNDHGIETRRPIEVVDWTNEEGARFQPPMLCSSVWGEKVTLDWALSRTDDAGITLAEALEKSGFAGDAPVGGCAFDSYFELHIEQGPELAAQNKPVGIVTGAYSSMGMRVEVTGDTAHAGPMPMAERKDAIFGAALLAVAVNRIGRSYAPLGKATAPRIEAWPNKPGIVSERATLFVDFRHPDPDVVANMQADVEDAVKASAAEACVEIEIAEQWSFGGVEFDEGLIELVRDVSARLNYETLDLFSQAGHDAYNMSRIAPTALIFTPCDDGLSHNERENTRVEDQTPGITLLLNAVIERANR